jgi:hypothetical protein
MAAASFFGNPEHVSGEVFVLVFRIRSCQITFTGRQPQFGFKAEVGGGVGSLCRFFLPCDFEFGLSVTGSG